MSFLHSINWPYVAELLAKAIGSLIVLFTPWVMGYLWLIGII